MPDRPKYSRFRRLPGLYRFGDRKPADPHAEPQLLSLYMPGHSLDQAELLALRAGGITVQSYCEALLRDAIESEDSRVHDEQEIVKNGPMKSLEELADDPENLAEWVAIARDRQASPVEADIPLSNESIRVEKTPVALAAAREVVLRHAGMGDEDPFAFLPSLRAGTAIGIDGAEELLGGLAALEEQLQDSEQVDRRLAYALHRLAFEGQILLTEAYPAQSADPTAVEVLRRVQESVDRVLSGEDIRYYSERPPSTES